MTPFVDASAMERRAECKQNCVELYKKEMDDCMRKGHTKEIEEGAMEECIIEAGIQHGYCERKCNNLQ